MSLPVLELPSDPRRRGEAHGEALRAEARALYEGHVAQLAAQPPIAARGITGDEPYQAYAARFQPHVERFAPELWTEMEGIAAGSDMTALQILGLNLYLESYDLPHPAAPALAGGCTAWAHRRAGGDTVVGQTYDMPRIFEPAAFVMKTRTGNIDLLALSFAGVVAACGLSSGGFAVVINKLYGTDSRIGVPYTVLVRCMLEQSSPGWALTRLLGCERAGSMNYILGDTGGLLFNIETTATGWESLQEGDPFVVHANHFLGTRGKGFEGRDFSHYGAHTLMRYARARQLMGTMAEDAALEGYRALLCDRHNDPWGIYTEEPPGGFKGMKTVASVIFEPASGSALMSRGHAGDAPMQRLGLTAQEQAAE